jgi:hypothetical protein
VVVSPADESVGAVCDGAPHPRDREWSTRDNAARRLVRELRVTLAHEQLGRGLGEDADLIDPSNAVRALRRAARLHA